MNRYKSPQVETAINPPKDPAARPIGASKLPQPGQAQAEPNTDHGRTSPGMIYAKAMQQGDWHQVVAKTLWMQDRLERVRMQRGNDTAVEEALTVIEAELSQRSITENQVTAEGVEDKYVFAPGAEIEWQSADEGRQDLEAPALRRDWIRVTYPSRERALRDQENIPLRSLLVGVNYTAEGQVLKANVVGNLDIDDVSFDYDW